MKFTNVITIDRAPVDVFAYLARFENVPRWNYAISETRKTTSGPVGVGTRYAQTRTVPAPGQETFEVTEFEVGRKLSIRGTLGRLPAEITYLLEPAGTGTRLTNTVGLQPRGGLSVVAAVAAPRLRSAVAANLGVLARILERGG